MPQLFFTGVTIIILLATSQVLIAEIEFARTRNGRRVPVESASSMVLRDSAKFSTPKFDDENHALSETNYASDSPRGRLNSAFLRDLPTNFNARSSSEKRRFSFLLESNESTNHGKQIANPNTNQPKRAQSTGDMITNTDIQVLQKFVKKLKSSVRTTGRGPVISIPRREPSKQGDKMASSSNESALTPNDKLVKDPHQQVNAQNPSENEEKYPSGLDQTASDIPKAVFSKERRVDLQPASKLNNLSKSDVDALLEVAKEWKRLHSDGKEQRRYGHEHEVSHNKNNRHAGSPKQHYNTTKHASNAFHEGEAKNMRGTELTNGNAALNDPGQKLKETVDKAIANTTQQLLQFIKLEKQLKGLQNSKMNESKKDIPYANSLKKLITSIRNFKTMESDSTVLNSTKTKSQNLVEKSDSKSPASDNDEQARKGNHKSEDELEQKRKEDNPIDAQHQQTKPGRGRLEQKRKHKQTKEGNQMDHHKSKQQENKAKYKRPTQQIAKHKSHKEEEVRQQLEDQENVQNEDQEEDEQEHEKQETLDQNQQKQPQPQQEDHQDKQQNQQDQENESRNNEEIDALKLNEYNIISGRQNEQPLQSSNTSTSHQKSEDDVLKEARHFRIETMKHLIASLAEDPFDTWIYHQRNFGELGITPSLLKAGIVNLGSSKPVQHAVRKAVRGENVKLLVVGGSISAGGGLWKDRGNIDGVYHRALAHWWEKTVTPVTNSKMEVNNVAIGGTDSEYFSYCINNFLEDSPDIVLWELSANDYNRFNERNFDPSKPLEQLTRIILQLPSHPALIYVNFFRGDKQNFQLGEKCPDSEETEVDILSRYYDIPSLSWRRMVCNLITKRTFVNEELFGDDGYHPNLLGHAQVAMLLMMYIKGVFESVLANDLDNMKRFDILDDHNADFQDVFQLKIPAFKDPLNPKPSCWTLLTPDYAKIFKNTLNEVNVLKGYGFELRNVTAWSVRTDRIQCLFATKSGAELDLSLSVPVLDDDRNLPLADAQTRILAIATHNKFGGAAEIQLDDLPSKTSLSNGTGKLKQNRVHIVSEDVRPGVHNLRFRSLSSGFCLTSIMVI